MVVLDTDHVSLLEWVTSPERSRLVNRLEQLADDEIATSIISYEEQTRGWLAYVARARTVADQVKTYAKLSKHLETYRHVRVVDFDERAAIQFQSLRKARVRVGSMDLKIAAIALAHDALLLSRNQSDFRQVPGLKVEDWTV
jgi:tRNA(fMet)-specific endonuclease VapC